MITVDNVVFRKTLWALDKEDTPREVTLTLEFVKMIESVQSDFGFDRNRPVDIYASSVEVLFAGIHPHTIDPTRIFTTEKGARQSVKDRRKLKELDNSFDALPDQDAFIKDIIKTQVDLSTLDSTARRIMKKWLNTPTKK